MKRAYAIEEKKNGFVVWVNDCGRVAMCDYNPITKVWETCYFKTYEEAEQAKNDYNEVWSN